MGSRRGVGILELGTDRETGCRRGKKKLAVQLTDFIRKKHAEARLVSVSNKKNRVG